MIKQWEDRTAERGIGPREAMQAEIAELRVELEKLQKQEPVACTEPVGDGFAEAMLFVPLPVGVKLYLAAGAQQVPEGYQLVPIEPTLEMMVQMPACANATEWKQYYKAMLEAAKKEKP